MLNTPLRVLLVEDNEGDAELVRIALAERPGQRMELVHVERLSDALRRLAEGGIDVVLLDLSLPDAFELEGLRQVRAAAPRTPIVVLTSSDEAFAARAAHEGAQDYLPKGQLEGGLLVRALRYALERQQYSERALQLAEARAGRAAAEEAKNRALLLAEASTLLGSSLDFEAALGSVARLVVPRLADLCVVVVADDAQPQARQVAAAHARPELEALVSEYRARFPQGPDAPGGVPEVIRSGRALLVSEVTDGQLSAHATDPDQLRLLRELAPRSVIVAPLAAHGATLGALTLVTVGPRRPLDADDLVLAEELGRRAASAVENARLYRRARDAVAVRDEFLSVASHELRTPLSALHLQIQSLQLAVAREPDPELKARYGRKLTTAAGQVVRLTRLIDALLDVSRIATGRLVLEPQEVDLAALTRDVVERFSEPARAERSQIHLMEGGRPVGFWDPLALEQILTNLLANAVKYGHGKPIEVTVGAAEGFATVAVKDLGIGIAPVDADRIFGRFERAVSSRNYGGLGLGLYITRTLVEAHGGSIKVESAPGQGAAFTVRLPLERAGAAPGA